MKKIKKILNEIIESSIYAIHNIEIQKRFEGRKKLYNIFPSAKDEFGDYSTNIAIRLSGDEYTPEKVADILIGEISKKIPSFIEKVEEKNGFINFFFKKEFYFETLIEILQEKEKFGSSDIGKEKKVIIEFVSANPTGPLTIAHGRQASFGEALSRIFSFSGYSVTKEYYLNDAGKQIELLGESLKARYEQLKGKEYPIPEEGYWGEYLIEIAKKIKGQPQSQQFFKNFAVEEILKDIEKDLKDFGVKFDNWVNENNFLLDGSVEKTIELLEKKGLVYYKDGAKWFKSSSFGDDKDRVLVKKDGSYTYLAPDIAYHKNKIERGFDIIINLWGPDHLGYIPRLKAAVESLGFSSENLKIVIVQLTTLYKGKEKLQMSTRKGQFITLRQLIEEIGPDASKFFFLFRKPDSHLDFDLEIAKKQSLENPVYYLQYAYVRILHVLNFAKEKNIEIENLEKINFSIFNEEEIKLIKKLSFFSEIIEKITQSLEVHLLTEFLFDLSKNFHSYYQKFRIVSEEKELTIARLSLVKALFYVFSNSLYLLNISLPEKM